MDVHPQELADGVFELRYDCVRDQYTRPLLRSSEPLADFVSLAEKSGGVYRKVEPNWRAFLTSDGPGALLYTINHPGAIVQNAEVRMNGLATFRQGEVGATIICGKKTAEIPLANEPFLAEKQGEKKWAANREPLVETMRVHEVGEADQTIVTIQFEDKTPNAGLDHDLDDAQVFRTPLDQPNSENLVIRLEFARDPVIKVTDAEREAGKFELNYDCTQDQYTRPSDLQAQPEPILDYATLASRRGGTYRKVEPDWRAFLTSDGPGILQYIIAHAGARVKSAEALLTGVTTFRQGEIGFNLKSGEKSDSLPLTNDKFLAEQQGDRIWGQNREPIVEKLRVENAGQADQTVLTIKFGDRTPNTGLDHDLDDAQVFRNPLAEPRPDNLIIRIEFETPEPPAVEENIHPPMNENLTEKPKKALLFESDKNEDPVIVVTDSEHAVGHFELQYDSVRDQYRRPFDPQIVQPIEKYETLAAQRGGVFRKVEPEWRAFLASKMAGALRYTILHSGARVKSAEARMNGVATFRQGAIGAQLKSGDKTDTIPLENAPFLAEQQGDRVWGLNREPVVEKMRVDDVGDADKTTLVIFFNDKTENEQLDHDLDDAQVFRTPLDKPDPENLVIHIEFVMPQQMPENLEKLEKPTPEVESTADDFGKLLKEAGSGQQTDEDALKKILIKISHMTIMERYTIVTIIRNKFGLDPANTLRDRFGSSYERKIVYINFDKTGQEAQNQSIEEKPEPEVNAVADALGAELAKGPINRYRVVQLVRVKYGIELADALKKQLIGFDQLINLLLISQLERISSVYEEQQITKQMAQLTSASDYKLVSNLRATPDELNSVRCFLLKYDCARDQYMRPFNFTGQRVYNGYPSLLHSSRDVQRMMERGEGDEYAYIASDGDAGELIWRIEHPGAHVSRVQVLISGMATLDDDAKIGVDLRCGEEESLRRPDAIPYNAQRIDIMEMDNVGPANFTEVIVNFIREPAGQNKTKRQPSQLFRAVFGDAATADDFVIRIEYTTPKGDTADKFNAKKEELAQELNQKLQAGKGGDSGQIVQIITIISTLTLVQRQELLTLIKSKFGVDLENELKSALPKESGTDLAEQLFKSPTEIDEVPILKSPAEIDEVPIQPAQNLEEQPPTTEQNVPPAQTVGSIPPPKNATPKVLDLDQAAELIYKSISRGGGVGGLMKMFKKAPKSDTDQILSILTASNYNTRQLIAQAYRNRYEHEDLIETINKELPDDGPKELILALLYSMDVYDAVSLHNAMKGLGTDELVLTEILVTRTNEQIRAIRKAYTELYNKQLEGDVGGDTSGTYKRLLSNLCAANRDESGTVNGDKARQDAQALFGAGEKRLLGTNETTFLALLTRDNQLQLNALFHEYERLTGKPMEKALASEFSGDALEAMNAIVQYARNPAQYFADRFNVSIKNQNERDLIRLVVTRAESGDMPVIGAEFKRIYGLPLTALIVSDSKASTKQILANLAKAYGGGNTQ
uniref:Annexin n=1 Tax=Globodera rostochiensis TaxID=31243 RepID=A0A914HY21_GLORO